MDYLSAGAKKSGRCREVAVSGVSTVFSINFLKVRFWFLPPRAFGVLTARSTCGKSIFSRTNKFY